MTKINLEEAFAMALRHNAQGLDVLAKCVICDLLAYRDLASSEAQDFQIAFLHDALQRALKGVFILRDDEVITADQAESIIAVSAEFERTADDLLH